MIKNQITNQLSIFKNIQQYINTIIINNALTFWDDKNFGFYERKDTNGIPLIDLPKRLMATSRQLYVFTSTYNICELNNNKKDYIITNLYNLLINKFHDKRYGGFVFSIADTKKDLYGLAFAIFGLAHYYSLTKEQSALNFALDTLDLITNKLYSPYGGFLEHASQDWQYQPGSRKQNPHMHLLEALISLYKIYPDAQIAKLCDHIVELCIYKFTNNQAKALLEEFDYDWNILNNNINTAIIEPGHHFEWIWLLLEYANVFNKFDKINHIITKLWNFAYQYGVDKQQGGVYNQINIAGKIIDNNKRLWPSFEYLKAINAYAKYKQQNFGLEQHIQWLFNNFLSYQQPGWLEFLDANNKPIKNQQYISSCYHIVMALLDVSN